MQGGGGENGQPLVGVGGGLCLVLKLSLLVLIRELTQNQLLNYHGRSNSAVLSSLQVKNIILAVLRSTTEYCGVLRMPTEYWWYWWYL